MAKTNSIKLSMLGLPVFQTIEEFSEITHISKYTIFQLSSNASYHYKTYTIPKKSGKPRSISQPSKKLKGLQSWILVNILNKLKVSSSCKGFERRSSTLDNALPHRGANTLLAIDLKDFFHTVKEKQVFNIFKTIGYNKLISTILTNICVYNGHLPQGGPCSPKLANLATWMLDLRIQGYVGKMGINYTRYADDLSFSGLSPARVVKIIPVIDRIINEEGFQINKAKTRVAGAARAKIVTGLVVNNEGVGIGKEKYKELRAKIHHLTLPIHKKDIKLLNEIRGWLSYLNSVDKKRHAKALTYIASLSKLKPKTLVAQLIKQDESVT